MYGKEYLEHTEAKAIADEIEAVLQRHKGGPWMDALRRVAYRHDVSGERYRQLMDQSRVQPGPSAHTIIPYESRPAGAMGFLNMFGL